MQTRKFRQVLREEMEKNAELLRNSLEANLEQVIRSSFRNILLIFVVINGKEYPANSKILIGDSGGFRLKHRNPHEDETRIEYDEERKKLYVEKMSMVPHPFISHQRVDGEMGQLCGLFGYERFGFTDPSRKVPRWENTGEEFPLDSISSAEIIPFKDSPGLSWYYEDRDHTAFRLIITTRPTA